MGQHRMQMESSRAIMIKIVGRGIPESCACIEMTNDNNLIMIKCDEPNYEDGHDYIKINKVKVEDSKRAENFGILNDKKVLIDYGHSKNIRLLKELRKKGDKWIITKHAFHVEQSSRLSFKKKILA